MSDIYITGICLYGNIKEIRSKYYTYASEISPLNLSRELKIKYYAGSKENAILYKCYQLLINKYPDIQNIENDKFGIYASSTYGLKTIQGYYNELLQNNISNQFVFRQTANNLLSTLLCININKICYATTVIDPISMGKNALEVAQLMMQAHKFKYVLVASVNCHNNNYISGMVVLTTNKEAKYGRLLLDEIDSKRFNTDIGTVGAIYAISNNLEEKVL